MHSIDGALGQTGTGCWKRSIKDVGIYRVFGCQYGIRRLGIIKEMEPQYVATFSEKPQVLEGHPFVVEAGVSLGGAEVKHFDLETKASRVLFFGTSDKVKSLP